MTRKIDCRGSVEDFDSLDFPPSSPQVERLQIQIVESAGWTLRKHFRRNLRSIPDADGVDGMSIHPSDIPEFFSWEQISSGSRSQHGPKDGMDLLTVLTS